MLVEAVLSQRKPGLAGFKYPVPEVEEPPITAADPVPIRAILWYSPIASLPTTPQPARNLRSEKDSGTKSNSDKRSAAAKDGKTPHLLFAPNLEEPSRRTVPVNINLPPIS